MEICDYRYYVCLGGGYYHRFLDMNPEFRTEEFERFVIGRNRGSRDLGELGDVAKHEILRLAYEFEEICWSFPDAYGPHDE